MKATMDAHAIFETIEFIGILVEAFEFECCVPLFFAVSHIQLV
jgi:hypothetical protein